MINNRYLRGLSIAAIVFTTLDGGQAADVTEETDSCVFESKYFSSFDLNPVTKPAGEDLYNTEDVAFIRNFQFNLCENMDGTEFNVLMTESESQQEIYFGGEHVIEPYLQSYGAKISGSRGLGNVRGVKLTYSSSEVCQIADADQVS